MAKSDWTENQTTELVEQHGAVPPPYFMYPEIHPYEFFWRMGHGESYIGFFWDWWASRREALNETQRVEYFRQFPPPPLWLTWMIGALWAPGGDDLGLDPDEDEGGAYAEYFKRTEELGFGTQDDCQRAWRLACEEFGDEFNGSSGCDESSEIEGNANDEKSERIRKSVDK